MTEFLDFFNKNYGFSKVPGIALGRPQFQSVETDVSVILPLSSLNKHGLIAGSTGTGKSRALQLMAEVLASQGVSVFLSDVKGDVSGFAAPNDAEKVRERSEQLKIDFSPKTFSTNYWSLSNRFIPLRLNLSDVSPVLISKLLQLNPTQESHLSMIFIFAKEKQIIINDFSDLLEVSEFLKENPRESSGISPQSIDVILRKISVLLNEGIDSLFGEPARETADLLRPATINVLNLSDVRKHADMLSIVMSFVLYKLFNELHDIGDTQKPKAVFFIDEAHYLFENANPSLVQLLVTILRQIRSKGIGVVFVTQNPNDIDDKILGLLGTKIQFAMRVFAADDVKDLKAIAGAFPKSDFYALSDELKTLAVGTGFVSALNPKGELLSPVKTVFFPPQSFMDVLPDETLLSATDTALVSKYSAKRPKTENATDRLSLSNLAKIKPRGLSLWEVEQKIKMDREKQNPPAYVTVPRTVSKLSKSLLPILLVLLVILLILALAALIAMGKIRIG